MVNQWVDHFIANVDRRRRRFRQIFQAAELFEGNVKDDDFGKVVSISGLSDELPFL